MKTFDELSQICKTLKIELPQLNEEFYEFGELNDKKKFDSKNPDVKVKGVGVYKLEQLKKNIVDKLEEVFKKAKDGDFEVVDWALNQKGILVHFIKAVLDVQKELASPNIKRKMTMMKKQVESKRIHRNIIKEVAPPSEKIEQWIKDNKESFIKQYGKEKGIEILYSKAWAKFKEKK